MLRVAALTSGRNTPSARLRIRQHVGPLRCAGIDVHEVRPIIDKYAPPPRVLPAAAPPLMTRLLNAGWLGAKLATRLSGLAASWRAPITWLERQLIPGFLTLEPLLRHPYVLDVDDAIWLKGPRSPRAAARVAADAAVVCVGNAFLADWFGRYARDIRIVPTAVDTDRFHARPSSDHGRGFTVGWIGTPSNFGFLIDIEPALAGFLEAAPEARLLIVSSSLPPFQRLDRRRVLFVPWSHEGEAEAVRRMDVGIMPLDSTDWSKGKCSFKMLQYMATGIPSVVTPVGMNADVLRMGEVGLPALSQTDWCDALMLLYRDRPRRERCGAAGRTVAETHYSVRVVTEQLAGIFRGLQ